MANVPPEIMNHLRRERLRRDNGQSGTIVPSQRRSAEDMAAPAEPEQDSTEQEPIGVKGILSRFALRVTKPELSGD